MTSLFTLGNEPGWVPLNTLLDFNRLKKLTMDTTLIATALKQSTSGLLEVSEDNTKVRRLTTIPDINENLLFEPEKTVYAKGFPLDITIDDLESFFESFGKITIIRRRTFPSKNCVRKLVFYSLYATGQWIKRFETGREYRNLYIQVYFTVCSGACII